jgi:uncharacterized protein
MTLRTHAAKPIVLVAAVAILASCALLACFGGHESGTSRNEVRVKVTDVGFDEQSNAHYVMLADQNGRRGMPIIIGDDEARTIMLELNGIKPDRPLTADLLRNVIQQTGNHVDRVVIGDMRNQVFYAQIYLDHDRYVVDSRPSDAIALAMGTQVPIYINGEIFNASAQTLDSAPPQFAALDGITVQDLTPAIASYFGVAPSSGVLVADITPSAASALKRGDIITQLDGWPVPNPAAFKEHGDRSNGVPLKLALLRDGHSMTVALNPVVTH